MQYSATEFIGKRGVEAYYEDTLHGQVGYQKAESDALGRLRQTLDVQSPTAGKNLHLHLDIDLQRAGVAALAGRRGAVVALDPRDGGVLAMVSQPSYDPNFFVTGMSTAVFDSLSTSKYVPLFNRATNGQYAPGSTFKPIVGLAGIGLSATMWDTVIEDRGAFHYLVRNANIAIGLGPRTIPADRVWWIYAALFTAHRMSIFMTWRAESGSRLGGLCRAVWARS